MLLRRAVMRVIVH